MAKWWMLTAGAALVAAMTAAAEPPHGMLVSGDATAQVSWLRTFASPGDDWVNDLIPLASGELMAVGFLGRVDGDPPSDWTALAARLSAEGDLLARHDYGQGGGIDAFWSMAADQREGAFTFAGFTTRLGHGGIDALVLEAASDGRLVTERAFGGPGYDRFTDLAVAPDGYVFLGHSQAEHEDKRRIFLVRTRRDGAPRWQRIHDAADNWSALYVEPAGDGGFIIAGGTTIAGDGDMFAMKVDADGRELWRRRAGTPDWDEVNHGLVVRPDGSIVLTGYTHRRGEEANDLVAATLSPSGDVQRIERLGGAADDRSILAKPGRDGRIWIVGHTASAGSGGVDLLLASLDRQGRFAPAAVTVGGSADDHGTAVLPLDDGSLVLAGYSRGLGDGGQDAFVLRLSAPAWDRPNAAFRRVVVAEP